MRYEFIYATDLIIYSPHDITTGAYLRECLEGFESCRRVIVIGSLTNVHSGDLVKAENLVVCSKQSFFRVFNKYTQSILADPVKWYEIIEDDKPLETFFVYRLDCPNVDVRLYEVESLAVNAKSLSSLNHGPNNGRDVLLVKNRGEVTGTYLASLLTDLQTENPIDLIIQAASHVSGIQDHNLAPYVSNLVLVSNLYEFTWEGSNLVVERKPEFRVNIIPQPLITNVSLSQIEVTLIGYKLGPGSRPRVPIWRDLAPGIRSRVL